MADDSEERDRRTEIRNLVARRIDETHSIRRIASDARLPTNQVDWSGAADNVWFSVFEVAENHNKFGALLDKIQRVCPDDQELKKFLGTTRETSECPFPGLASFSESNKKFFFGREKDRDDALKKLTPGLRWLRVEGASGVGKSSFVHAALVSEICAQRLPDRTRPWRVATLRPGHDALASLAEALFRVRYPTAEARSKNAADSGPVRALDSKDVGLARYLQRLLEPGGERIVLVIDQFEEVFQQKADDSQKRFVEQISKALACVDLPLLLVTTMRSDRLDAVDAFPELREHFNAAATYHLGPLGRDDLRRVIEEPLSGTGSRMADGLVDRILDDAAAEQSLTRTTPNRNGVLPLLAEALRALWERRDGAVLTHAEYQSLGGLTGALRQRADALLDAQKEDREHALSMLLSLVSLREGAPPTRRMRPRKEVLDASGADHPTASRVLHTLEEARLITISAPRDDGDSYVDLVHEALLDQWPVFADRISRHKLELLMRDRIQSAAENWSKTRSDDRLARGEELAEYKMVPRHHLSENAREFLRRAEEREVRSRRQKRAALATVSSIILAFAAFATVQWRSKANAIAKTTETHEQFLGYARTVANADPANAERQRELATELESLARWTSAQGDLSSAIPRFREALRIRHGLVARPSSPASWQWDLGRTHTLFAGALFEAGRRDTAINEQREALRLFTRYANESGAPLGRITHALSQYILATLLCSPKQRRGELTEARSLAEHALATLRELQRTNQLPTAHQPLIADISTFQRNDDCSMFASYGTRP